MVDRTNAAVRVRREGGKWRLEVGMCGDGEERERKSRPAQREGENAEVCRRYPRHMPHRHGPARVSLRRLRVLGSIWHEHDNRRIRRTLAHSHLRVDIDKKDLPVVAGRQLPEELPKRLTSGVL